MFLLIVELAWEYNLEANEQISFGSIIFHVVLLVIDSHALSLYHFDSFRGDHLIDSKEHRSPIEQRNFHRLAFYGLLKGDLVPVDKIILFSHVTRSHVVVTTESWSSCLELYE